MLYIKYKISEAVIFGDAFAHETEPYARTESLKAMLSFNLILIEWYWHVTIKKAHVGI